MNNPSDRLPVPVRRELRPGKNAAVLHLWRRHSTFGLDVERWVFLQSRPPKQTAAERETPAGSTAYLERQYPLRPSIDTDDLSLPPPPEPDYVPLESVKVDIPPLDSPRLHRRTASTVSQTGGEKTPALNGNGHADEDGAGGLEMKTTPSLPPVDKIVLLRRVAADQIFRCVGQGSVRRRHS